MRTPARWLVGSTALVVLVGGGAAAYAQSRGSNPASTYRLTTVATGTVEETLTEAGTVDKEHRSDVAFGTSGTLASVPVKLGQPVTAGQVIATLETTDAQADVDSAQATLAKARAQLVSDEDAQSSTVSSSTAQTSTPKTTKPKTTTTPTPTPTPTSGPSTAAVTAALAQLATQQQAVTSGQSAVTAALADAADALTAQTTACGSVDPTQSGVSQACQDALTAVQAKQQAVKAAEDALSQALTALTTTLTDAVATLQQAASSSRTTASLTAYRTTSAATTITSADTDQTQTVTAATLAKDQAAIDTARAELITAQRALAATVVTAPMAGTVASLSLTKGDSVAAGDTAAVITSGRALLIGTTVSEAKIREITVGQKVVVSTPGSAATSQGTVTAIGVTADSSSSSVAYPVTVQVPSPSSMLASGSSVVLRIVTSTASDAVTVPSSAVTTSGSRSTVRVYRDGAVTATPVTLGAVGSIRTQIVSGLKVGQRIVLADLTEEVTGASTSVNTRGGFGGPGGTGGPPGAGAGAGTGGPPSGGRG